LGFIRIRSKIWSHTTPVSIAMETNTCVRVSALGFTKAMQHCSGFYLIGSAINSSASAQCYSLFCQRDNALAFSRAIGLVICANEYFRIGPFILSKVEAKLLPPCLKSIS